MLTSIVNDLITVANNSDMSNHHAAALICGKRKLAMGNNCSLPSCKEQFNRDFKGFTE